MSKLIHGMGVSLLFFITTLPIAEKGYSAEGTTYIATTGSSDGSSDDALDAIKKYLYNLGGNFGYDLQNDVDPRPITTLITPPEVATLDALAQNAFNAMFGAIPSGAAFLFIAATGGSDSDSSLYAKTINPLANGTFPSYATTNQPAAISPLIDQQPYQTDPVSQAVYNIIGTPDFTFCMMNDLSGWDTKNYSYPACGSFLYQVLVMNNVLGVDSKDVINTFPASPFYTPQSSSNAQDPLLSELNGNTLIAPLLYSTSSPSDQSGGQSQSKGLIGTSQLEQAANFIRYATNAVIPVPLASRKDYSDMYSRAVATPTATNLSDIIDAQSTLTSYLSSIRVYAAKSSVAISNLYAIMSRRLPQTQAPMNGASQALIEMQMATRRLYDPSQSSTTQWTDSINNASPATVQKEMAILLSEINYQMYLSRQQDERMLLTNSLLLLQMLSTNQPRLDVGSSTGG